jgi:hypothetical protein
MPDTAVVGTTHVVDSVQFPQSMRLVVLSARQAGWTLPVTLAIDPIFRAPIPP